MSDAAPSGFDGSSVELAQERLELGEDLFDGVEVRGVGRKEQELGPGETDGTADRLAPVVARVVHDDDIAGPQDRGPAPIGSK